MSNIKNRLIAGFCAFSMTIGLFPNIITNANTNNGSTYDTTPNEYPFNRDDIPQSQFGADTVKLMPTYDNGTIFLLNSRRQSSPNPLVENIVSKYDENFNLLWSAFYGDGGSLSLNSMIEDNDKNIVLVGREPSDDPYKNNGVFIKYSQTGELLIDKRLEFTYLNDKGITSQGDLRFDNIFPLNNGNYLVEVECIKAPTNRFMLLDSEGNLLNENFYGVNGDYYLYNDIYDNHLYIYTRNSVSGTNNVYTYSVKKFNFNGEMVGEFSINNDDISDIHINGITVVGDGFLLYGESKEVREDTNYYNRYAYYKKFDTNGNLLSSKRFLEEEVARRDNTGDWKQYSIKDALVVNDNIYFISEYETISSPFLIRTDLNGNEISKVFTDYGYPDITFLGNLIKDNNGNIRTFMAKDNPLTSGTLDKLLFFQGVINPSIEPTVIDNGNTVEIIDNNLNEDKYRIIYTIDGYNWLNYTEAIDVSYDNQGKFNLKAVAYTKDNVISEVVNFEKDNQSSIAPSINKMFNPVTKDYSIFIEDKNSDDKTKEVYYKLNNSSQWVKYEDTIKPIYINNECIVEAKAVNIHNVESSVTRKIITQNISKPIISMDSDYNVSLTAPKGDEVVCLDIENFDFSSSQNDFGTETNQWIIENNSLASPLTQKIRNDLTMKFEAKQGDKISFSSFNPSVKYGNKNIKGGYLTIEVNNKTVYWSYQDIISKDYEIELNEGLNTIYIEYDNTQYGKPFFYCYDESETGSSARLFNIKSTVQGYKTIKYRQNNGDWKTYNGNFVVEFTDEPKAIIEAKGIDNLGNESEITILEVDKPISKTPTIKRNNLGKVELIDNNLEEERNKMYYRMNYNPSSRTDGWIEYVGPFDVEYIDTNCNIEAKSVNFLNFDSDITDKDYNLTPPEKPTISVDEDFKVTITDESDNDSIKEIKYKQNGGDWRVYNEVFEADMPINSEDTIIEAKAITFENLESDIAIENVEKPNALNPTIEKNNNYEYVLKANNDGINITKEIYYRVNGEGEWILYTDKFNPEYIDDKTEIEVKAVNVFDKESETINHTFDFDRPAMPNIETTEDYKATINTLIEIESIDESYFSNPNWSYSDGLLKSETISHRQSTYNDLTVNVPKNTIISMDIKTSTESGWDIAYIYINDIEVYKGSGNQTSYTNYKYNLNEGKNVIKFSYLKDGSGNVGDDCIYIDNIKLINNASNIKEVQYRQNGGNWQVYNGIFDIELIENNSNPTLIEAKSIAFDGIESPINSVEVEKPNAAIPSIDISDDYETITITDNSTAINETKDIYYKLNSSKEWILYEGPFTSEFINAECIVNTKVINKYNKEIIYSTTFEATSIKPSISHNDENKIVITDNNEDVLKKEILYKLNNSDEWVIYKGPFSPIYEDYKCIVEAKAINKFNGESDVETFEKDAQIPNAPTISVDENYIATLSKFKTEIVEINETFSSLTSSIKFSNPKWYLYTGYYKSETISHNSSTSTKFKVVAKEGDELSLDVMVSSERNYDKGYIYVNGSQVYEGSGMTSFTNKVFTLKEGLNIIEFKYTKDSSQSRNKDCMYIDNISYNEEITVEDDTVKEIQYKQNNGEWTTYSEPFAVEFTEGSQENTTITAKSISYENFESEEATLEVEPPTPYKAYSEISDDYRYIDLCIDGIDGDEYYMPTEVYYRMNNSDEWILYEGYFKAEYIDDTCYIETMSVNKYNKKSYFSYYYYLPNLDVKLEEDYGYAYISNGYGYDSGSLYIIDYIEYSINGKDWSIYDRPILLEYENGVSDVHFKVYDYFGRYIERKETFYAEIPNTPDIYYDEDTETFELEDNLTNNVYDYTVIEDFKDNEYNIEIIDGDYEIVDNSLLFNNFKFKADLTDFSYLTFTTSLIDYPMYTDYYTYDVYINGNYETYIQYGVDGVYIDGYEGVCEIELIFNGSQTNYSESGFRIFSINLGKDYLEDDLYYRFNDVDDTTEWILYNESSVPAEFKEGESYIEAIALNKYGAYSDIEDYTVQYTGDKLPINAPTIIKNDNGTITLIDNLQENENGDLVPSKRLEYMLNDSDEWITYDEPFIPDYKHGFANIKARAVSTYGYYSDISELEVEQEMTLSLTISTNEIDLSNTSLDNSVNFYTTVNSSSNWSMKMQVTDDLIGSNPQNVISIDNLEFKVDEDEYMDLSKDEISVLSNVSGGNNIVNNFSLKLKSIGTFIKDRYTTNLNITVQQD